MPLHEGGHPGQVGLQPVLFLVRLRRVPQGLHHRVDVVLELGHLAGGVHRDRPGEVALGDGTGHLGDRPHLPGQVAGQLVHVLGEPLPGTRDTLDLGLATEPALTAHLTRHACDLGGERRQLVDHRVDRGLEFQDLAARVDVDLLGQVAVGDSRGHQRDVADLPGQIVRHRVDVVGEVLPRPGDVGHMGLASEASLGADLPGHAGHLVREGGQGVDHGVDRPRQCGDLALGLHSDLLRQVAAGNGRGHLGDGADLPGQVGGHHVDVVGEVLPGARHSAHGGLAAEVALGAHLTGHPGDLVGEGRQLVDHRVDGLLQLQDLAPRVHADLLRQIALRHGRGHLGDGADLGGQVVRHEVHRVGQIPPGAPHTLDVGLPAEPALGTHLPRHTRDLISERRELIDHRVDGVLQLQNLTARVDVDLLRQIPLGDGGGHLGDVTHLGGQVAGHGVDRVGQVGPGSGNPGYLGLTAQRALGPDLACHPGHLGGEQRQLVDHAVEHGRDLTEQAAGLFRQPGAEVAVAYRRQPGQQPPQLRLTRYYARILDRGTRLVHALPLPERPAAFAPTFRPAVNCRNSRPRRPLRTVLSYGPADPRLDSSKYCHATTAEGRLPSLPVIDRTAITPSREQRAESNTESTRRVRRDAAEYFGLPRDCTVIMGSQIEV